MGIFLYPCREGFRCCHPWVVCSQFIQVASAVRQHLYSLLCCKNPSTCLNACGVAASETCFEDCTFAVLHWDVLVLHTQPRCASLWIPDTFFFQLGLSHRSCEILEEIISTRQGATLHNGNKETAFVVVAVFPVHKPQEHLGQ